MGVQRRGSSGRGGSNCDVAPSREDKAGWGGGSEQSRELGKGKTENGKRSGKEAGG